MENYDTAKQFHLKSNAFLLKKLPRLFQQINILVSCAMDK